MTRRKSVQEIGYGDRIPVVKVEMTGEEAAAALKAGVEALFAGARGGDFQERCAYIRVGKEQTPYVYVTFSNGYKKDECEVTVPFREMSLPEMVERMVAAVAAEFPDHASQDAIWRIEPDYQWVERQRASRRFGIAAVPAHHSLYCRVVGVPPGAHGNCTMCGVLHHESEPHFLTEQAIEEVLGRAIAKGRQEFMSK